MRHGDSILLSLRVLALIVTLGVTGLGAWTKFIIHEIEVRGSAIIDDAQLESQEMVQLWRRFFATILDKVIEIWISIGCAAFASLVGIVIVLATILPRMRIPSAVLIPMECLCMCAIGAALGVSLSFTLDLGTSSKSRLDAGTSPKLTTFAMVVDLSRGYAVAAGAGWFFFLTTFIMATIDACIRTREKESCSFEPTASALGMAHGYAAVVPPPSHNRVPTMYDPQIPLNLNDANAAVWAGAQRNESADDDVGMGGADSITGEEDRISFGWEKEITGSLPFERVQRVQQIRPSRPWSEAPGTKRAEEVIHAM